MLLSAFKQWSLCAWEKAKLNVQQHTAYWLCGCFYSILFYPITLEGRQGTTDEFATIPFHLDLFSAALVELAKSIPVHSLILSSHLFFCLPLFLFPFTVPCRIVFAIPEDLETWPNHLSLVVAYRSIFCTLAGGGADKVEGGWGLLKLPHAPQIQISH